MDDVIGDGGFHYPVTHGLRVNRTGTRPLLPDQRKRGTQAFVIQIKRANTIDATPFEDRDRALLSVKLSFTKHQTLGQTPCSLINSLGMRNHHVEFHPFFQEVFRQFRSQITRRTKPTSNVQNSNHIR